MMTVLAQDSARIHNEMMHTGYVQYFKYAIPALLALGFLWVKFAKS